MGTIQIALHCHIQVSQGKWHRGTHAKGSDLQILVINVGGKHHVVNRFHIAIGFDMHPADTEIRLNGIAIGIES
ncbi:hypothetical protein D3C78_1577200 [compost metagenome]